MSFSCRIIWHIYFLVKKSQIFSFPLLRFGTEKMHFCSNGPYELWNGLYKFNSSWVLECHGNSIMLQLTTKLYLEAFDGDSLKNCWWVRITLISVLSELLNADKMLVDLQNCPVHSSCRVPCIVAQGSIHLSLYPMPKTGLASKRKPTNICRQKSALERACFA